MRLRLLAGTTTAAITAALAVAAVPSAPAPATWGPVPAYFTSDNVEHVANFPEHAGTAGGRLVGDHFYMFDPRGVSIYDVTDPAAPTLTGSVAFYQSGTSVALGQEDVDTNGEILIADGNPDPSVTGGTFHVIDVSDKANPQVLGSVGVTDHTWTCVLDCTYAYGRTGHIIDLTDPANPVLTDASWREASGAGGGYTHDFTEVAPGLLVSSGQPSYYLDATDPLAPELRTEIESRFSTLGYHGNQWARDATDRFLVMGTEIGQRGAVGGDCSNSEGVLHVYDTTDVRAADAAEAAGQPRPEAAFELLGEYMLPGPGVYATGSPPANTLYCTHWFDLHPAFADGGLVALGSYEQGVKFLEVTNEGQFEELGWFQPVGGQTGAAYWISDDIVYTADYRRGMDVLRFTP